MATRTDVTNVGGIEIGAPPVARSAPFRLGRARIVAAIFLAAAAVGAVVALQGPSAEELEQAHWQEVVDYYGGLYQTMAGAGASEAAHWQEVVDYYGGLYQTMAGAGAGASEAAHWQQVVDYYGGPYQTMAGAGASEAAHWQQVVDYYEGFWVPRRT
ncbi:hypothetical protein BH18ACT6_BH18ACT6_03200 [soil metagenome]